MLERTRIIGSQWVPPSQKTEEDRLDRALVTGLMMEVLLETSTLQADPQNRHNLVKSRLKTVMANHLAGRVTLKRFHHMLQEVDDCFPRYYSLIAPGSSPAPAAGSSQTPAPPSVCISPSCQVLRQDTLKEWLEDGVRNLLPQRSHRKLTARRLLDFLQHTGGGWFRLKDFEQHFGVDRKTAWEYVQKFLAAGLLCHNHQRSAAVRYALATQFLVVRVDALRPQVREALPELPVKQADQVCDLLAVTGGEPFAGQDWQAHFKPSCCRRIIASLQAAGLLEEMTLGGLGQMFKLPRHWLQD